MNIIHNLYGNLFSFKPFFVYFMKQYKKTLNNSSTISNSSCSGGGGGGGDIPYPQVSYPQLPLSVPYRASRNA
jgi:hypothetical protein